MFSLYGIKNVNMGDIATELGISKRTLYETFSNKKELVAATVESISGQVQYELQLTCTETSNPMDNILRINNALCRYMMSCCPAFGRDIKRFGDAIELISKIESHLQEFYTSAFRAGVAEGLFTPEGDYSMIISLYSNFPKLLQDEGRESLMYTLLRGVCTKKGIEEMMAYKAIVQ